MVSRRTDGERNTALWLLGMSDPGASSDGHDVGSCLFQNLVRPTSNATATLLLEDEALHDVTFSPWPSCLCVGVCVLLLGSEFQTDGTVPP